LIVVVEDNPDHPPASTSEGLPIGAKVPENTAPLEAVPEGGVTSEEMRGEGQESEMENKQSEQGRQSEEAKPAEESKQQSEEQSNEGIND